MSGARCHGCPRFTHRYAWFDHLVAECVAGDAPMHLQTWLGDIAATGIDWRLQAVTTPSTCPLESDE